MSSGPRAPIELSQDCEAISIPGGEKVTLRSGEHVLVTQTLGGSFTVQTQQGRLVRIGAADSGALGLDGPESEIEPADSGPFELQQVIDQLKTVFDPEIPINVVDLGLVYRCDAQPLADGTHRVEIDMSMTAPGCGMGDVLKEDARVRVQTIPGVSDVDIELVWDPPWDQSRMSDAARLELGMY
jgi:probable FeS assembly SUF system protein SufT